MRTALQKMAELLPQPTSTADAKNSNTSNNSDHDGGVGECSKASTKASAKASTKADTVEMATEYIMSLQEEITELKCILEENRQRLNAACVSNSSTGNCDYSRARKRNCS